MKMFPEMSKKQNYCHFYLLKEIWYYDLGKNSIFLVTN